MLTVLSQLEIEIVSERTKFGLNGAIRYAMSAENTGSFTITSGSSVSIPTEVKALETSATNLMSQNNNNQGDTNVEVQ